MPVPTELLSLDLPCDQHAPAIVRQALAEAAAELQYSDDGVLVASELVTNAVLHSGCSAGHRIQVHARVLSDGLLISVHDPGITGDRAIPRPAAQAPSSAGPTETAGWMAASEAAGPAPIADQRAGGWGLRIVDQLARRWGAERPDGYRVWAELALPS